LARVINIFTDERNAALCATKIFQQLYKGNKMTRRRIHRFKNGNSTYIVTVNEGKPQVVFSSA